MLICRKQLLTTVLVFASTLGFAACTKTVAPKSTTTTSTQSTQTNDTGDQTSTKTTETHIEKADGTQTMHRTQTTDQSVPASQTPPPPPPAPAGH